MSFTAAEYQQRFDFYVVGLTFVLLGASIQTSGFGASPVADVLEIGAWASLLVAGLLGLSRLEAFPRGHRIDEVTSHHKDQRLRIADDQRRGITLVQAANDGSTWPIAEQLEMHNSEIEKAKVTRQAIDDLVSSRYVWARRLFVLGIVALVLARGWVPVASLDLAVEAVVAGESSEPSGPSTAPVDDTAKVQPTLEIGGGNYGGNSSAKSK